MQIKVRNHLGEITQLDPLYYPVVNVDGLTPVNATINTSNIATVDGTFFNSSYVNQRNIVLTIVPDTEPEKARLFLYRFFKPKYPVRLYFKTSSRDVYIDGYVETFEGGLYAQKQAFQISVICPQPFFKNVETTIITQSKTVNAFTFPFSTPETGVVLSYIDANVDTNVLNEGEESTGVIISLLASGAVVEPTIYNRTTFEKFTVNVEMGTGDEIKIDTRRGEKSIVMLSNGEEINILNKIAKNSNWLALQPGDNLFTYDCVYGPENLNVTYSFNTLFGGV